MEQHSASYQSGVSEALNDIRAGRFQLRSRARGMWGRDLVETLKTRFGVDLIFLSCFTDAESEAFNSGYNRTMEAHIDGLFAPDSVAAVNSEVQHRRHAAYRRRFFPTDDSQGKNQ